MVPVLMGKMQMEWLAEAIRMNSPNADERPPRTLVDLLVIHAISLPPERYGTDHVERLFLNELDPGEHSCFEEIAKLRVSSHLYIKRAGELIQFVPLTMRAWHAGVSSWEGRERCNDFSIGIELEGCDTDAFTDHQYAVLCSATEAILQAYPHISIDRIVGHSDIAPGRKTDPGPRFNWARYRNDVRSRMGQR